MEQDNEEDLARLEDIRNLPPKVIQEALLWWNDVAPKDIKMFIIVATYFEYLVSGVEEVDEFIEEWKDN